jgi:hypothetical protein
MMTAEEAAEAGKLLTFEKVWVAFMQTDAKMERLAREVDERYKETDKLLKEVAERQKEADEWQKRLAREAEERRKEADERQKRLARETEEWRKEADERHKEIDKLHKEIAEQQKKTDKQLRENARQCNKLSINVGESDRSIGELVETLVAARLWEKFKRYSFNLDRAYQRVLIRDDTGRVRTDIDILLSNGSDCVVAVGVKPELGDIEDVEYHIRRMELIRQYPPKEIELNNCRLMGAMAGGVVDPEVTAFAYECGFFVLELTGETVQLAPPPPAFTPKTWT